MKFYCNLTDLDNRVSESGFSYYLLKNEGFNGSGIIAFLPREASKLLKEKLDDIILNDEVDKYVYEIKYHTYKAKDGQYKEIFQICDIVDSFPDFNQ